MLPLDPTWLLFHVRRATLQPFQDLCPLPAEYLCAPGDLELGIQMVFTGLGVLPPIGLFTQSGQHHELAVIKLFPRFCSGQNLKTAVLINETD